MRLAIISDIHANREALDAVLNSIENQKVDRIICLGDLVDYGVEPSYCINRVQRIADVCLLGNHDKAVATSMDLTWFNPEARKSAFWTREQLSVIEKKYLNTLPLSYSTGDWLFVHSTPDAPELWKYIINWFDAALQFDNFDKSVCFVGHSHVPGVFLLTENMNHYKEGNIQLRGQEKVIVNVGSVGQPRDRDFRACYVVADEEKSKLEFIRISYNVKKASEKIAAAGVSEMHAMRILIGI